MLHSTYVHTYIYAYFISRNTLSLFISASIATIEMKLRSLETEHENIANISSVREMLINIFGTRGIQNYVFLGLLKQIEFIANRYLEVTKSAGIILCTMYVCMYVCMYGYYVYMYFHS
jgi:hypothetical protein